MKDNQITLLYNLIPCQPLMSKRHGGGKYGEAVIRKIIADGRRVICVYDSTKWINPEILELLSCNHILLYDVNSISIPSIIEKEKTAVYFTPIVSKRTVGDWKCKIAGTIHGLRAIEMPADYMYCYYRGIRNIFFYLAYKIAGAFIRKRCIKRLNCFFSMDNFYPITVSEHSFHQIKHFFSVRETLPIYYSPSTNRNGEIDDNNIIEKFYLLVSAFVPFKNGLRAIIAFDRLFEKGQLQGYHVKITGVNSADQYRYKIKNKDRFEFMGFVDDIKLEQLYHDAYCLVYPSLNEGFGYPPIEAMHYATPVIASNMTSIPEICKDAAVFFNPYSVEELMAKIMHLQNETVWREYSERAIKQYQIVHYRQENDLKALVDYIYSI